MENLLHLPLLLVVSSDDRYGTLPPGRELNCLIRWKEADLEAGAYLRSRRQLQVERGVRHGSGLASEHDSFRLVNVDRSRREAS